MLTAAGKLITGDVVDEKMIGKIAEIVPQTMVNQTDGCSGSNVSKN